MRRSPFWGGFLGSLLGPSLARIAIRGGRYLLIGLVVLVGLALQWWQAQGTGTRVVVVLVTCTVLGLWVRRRFGSQVAARRPRRRSPAAEATQVLYRWWEPDTLPPGTTCYCGKPRRAGELVYVGITGAHRSRELDDDRRSACWWQPGLVGTTETYTTRDEVEDAEIRAIQTEHPRENKQHTLGWS